jgi:hypothetical protein
VSCAFGNMRTQNRWLPGSKPWFEAIYGSDRQLSQSGVNLLEECQDREPIGFIRWSHVVLEGGHLLISNYENTEEI